jgi:hypothetical protein
MSTANSLRQAKGGVRMGAPLCGLLLALTLAACGGSTVKPGPLVGADAASVNTDGYKLQAGKFVSWRGVVVLNPSDRPAEIERVALVGATKMKLTDVRAAGPGRKSTLGVGTTWPPATRAIIPLAGAVVPPKDPRGVQLYLKVVKTQAGPDVSRGIRLWYRQDGHKYSKVLPGQRLVLCDIDQASCTQFLETLLSD